jgi:hypothetical protein
MTPAEHARNQAISLEAKKDALSQRQSGDWKVSFTVQGVDMAARLTQAPMGTRYAMVLVEIGDDELPVQQPAKESNGTAATAPVDVPKPAGAKRDWNDMQPAAQSGVRCGEPTFWAFLREVHNIQVNNKGDAEVAVREICGVHSRVEFGTDHRKRVLWHGLDTEYLAWKALEHA